MTKNTSLFVSVALGATLLAACGDDDSPASPDAAVADAATADAATLPDDATPGPDAFAPSGAPSCAEFTTPASTLSTFPGTYAGDLAAAEANLEIAAGVTCTEENAAFGVASPGPDQVIALTGLTPGTRYFAKLDSPGDLAVYVVTGCNEAAPGPGADQCLSFTDAGLDGIELASFVAPADGNAFVVVDYWSVTEPPSATTYTLTVTTDGCRNDGDCTVPAASTCLPATATCGTYDYCTGDDTAAETQSDDGMAGATAVTLVATPVVIQANVCNNEALGAENDWYKFTVPANGGTVEVKLEWADTAADLDLEIYDGTTLAVGLSYWENPEVIATSFLAAGTYFVRVNRFAPANSAVATPYTITFTPGTPALCTSTADCASEFRNQFFRPTCSAGACVPLVADGNVALGGLCDSLSDCAAGATRCTNFPFTAGQDTRAVCSKDCTADADCTTVNADARCTTGLQTNFCTLGCAANNECPSRLGTPPPAGDPWAFLTCTVATGACGI